MSADFYQMQAEASTLPHAPAPEQTIYLVAAVDSALPSWSIRREHSYQEYETRTAAEAAASKLSGRWTHRTIIEIRLPAQQSKREAQDAGPATTGR